LKRPNELDVYLPVYRKIYIEFRSLLDAEDKFEGICPNFLEYCFYSLFVQSPKGEMNRLKKIATHLEISEEVQFELS